MGEAATPVCAEPPGCPLQRPNIRLYCLQDDVRIRAEFVRECAERGTGRRLRRGALRGLLVAQLGLVGRFQAAPRRFLLFQYCAADAWPLNNLPTGPDALNTDMLRGESPTKPRYTDVPPVPAPTQVRPGRGGSIYESQTQMKRRPLATSSSETLTPTGNE